jgi:hypothetical protein
MNKIYLLIGLLLTMPIQSIAVEQRIHRVACDKTTIVLDSLANRFNEIGIIAGSGLGPQQNHVISVWGNPENGTFTVVDTFGDMSCILGVGDNLKILLQDPEPNGPKI